MQNSILKIIIHLPYEREVWHYRKLNIENIRKAIRECQGGRHFANIDVNEKVYLFNKTIKNITSNYIPLETIPCKDRDPPYIKKNIKTDQWQKQCTPILSSKWK